MGNSVEFRFSQNFPFRLGDKVLINDIQRPGRVEAISIDSQGIQYRVIYWDNCERKTAWLIEDELTLKI